MALNGFSFMPGREIFQQNINRGFDWVLLNGVRELPPIFYHIVAVTRLKKPHSGNIIGNTIIYDISNKPQSGDIMGVQSCDISQPHQPTSRIAAILW